LGVAFVDTLTRSARLAQRFTFVRCCGSPRASSPHGLTAPAPAPHDGGYCVQLPPARGCYHLAPRRTFTSNPVPMPGTPTPSLRPKPYTAKTPNPAERHLSFAENCPDNRDHLSRTKRHTGCNDPWSYRIGALSTSNAMRALRKDLADRHHEFVFCRMGRGFWRRQNDHRLARSHHQPLRYPRNWKRFLPL
jgi:hypothetical protein